MSQHLEPLLSKICSIMKKHTDAALLQACAQLVSTLCSESYTFSSRAHLAFSQLMDDLTECFNTYLSDLLQVWKPLREDRIPGVPAFFWNALTPMIYQEPISTYMFLKKEKKSRLAVISSFTISVGVFYFLGYSRWGWRIQCNYSLEKDCCLVQVNPYNRWALYWICLSL